MTIRSISEIPESWLNLETCIRSDQVPASAINEIMESNPQFAEWYFERNLKQHAN